jgi:exosortase C (VPDSG-CTERM-specific)
MIAGGAFLGILIAFFLPSIIAWAVYAGRSELHSYVLLIPLIAGYLLWNKRDHLPKRGAPSPAFAAFLAISGILVYFFIHQRQAVLALSENDYLGLMMLSFLLLLTAGGLFFLGADWMAAAAFPVAFLYLIIPMPDRMVDILETASRLGSTEAANLFFTLSGTPFIRNDTFFQLPNVVIQVAQECSGIRSSWVLLLTSLFASQLFLRSPWRRIALVAFVIPLGLLRNGFRVMVIGLLCVHLGPEMIDSPIHRRGGPLFFVLSLVPFFLLLWWLRRGEQPQCRGDGCFERSPRKRAVKDGSEGSTAAMQYMNSRRREVIE